MQTVYITLFTTSRDIEIFFSIQREMPRSSSFTNIFLRKRHTKISDELLSLNALLEFLFIVVVEV